MDTVKGPSLGFSGVCMCVEVVVLFVHRGCYRQVESTAESRMCLLMGQATSTPARYYGSTHCRSSTGR